MAASQSSSSTSSTPSPSSSAASLSAHWVSAMVAGSVGGGCGIFVGYPFDSLKVRMQVGRALEFQTLNLAVLRQLYRGISTPLLTVGSISALNFSLFEYCKREMEKSSRNDSNNSNSSNSSSRDNRNNSFMPMFFMGDALDALPLEDELLSSSSSSLFNDDNNNNNNNNNNRNSNYNNDNNSSSTAAPRFLTVFTAGVASGVVSTFITNPLSVIKIRMQVASEAGLLSVMKEILSVNGVRTFYRGYPAHLISESYGRGVYLWTYEFVKAQIHHIRTATQTQTSSSLSSSSLSSSPSVSDYNSNNSGSDDSLSFVERYFYTSDTILPAHCEVALSTRIAAAAGAGIFSWFAIYPCDVIKARVQLDLQRKTYRGTWHCARETWRTQGLRGMFRGLSYTLIRAGPVAGTVLPIYDLVRSAVEKKMLA